MTKIQDLIQKNLQEAASKTTNQSGKQVINTIIAKNNKSMADSKRPLIGGDRTTLDYNHSDLVSVTVTPQPEYGMEWTDVLSTIFPPALLLKATDPTPMGGDPMPVTTVTGSPDALSNFLEQSPIIQTTPAAADPLSGIGGIIDLTIKILPLILVVGVFSSIKKVF